MDPITHAASGAVALLALKKRPDHRLALPLVALAATSPDADVFFASSPVQFLLLHRGITHSLAALPLMGLLLACAARPLWRPGTPGHWTFTRTWLFMSACVGLHIWLDAVTTYGTMIFLPFSHERIRLNGLFIVDPVFTLPLLFGLFYAANRASRPVAVAALAWVFCWPGFAVGLNSLHTANVTARLTEEGYRVERVTVLPDALSPLFWRVLFAENQGIQGQAVFEQGLDLLGRPRTPAREHKGAPRELTEALSRASAACKYFLNFTILPVISPLAENWLPGKTGVQSPVVDMEGSWLLYDLRFGSSLAFVRKLMALRPNADMPFQLMVELAKDSRTPPGFVLARERLRFSGSGRDSGWCIPRPPGSTPFWTWFAGLR
ncbi:MAG: metal-dependent hydrolase [Desulfovibrio sp.]|jgi:inner membrane protein|nr:metal-dependent hydrolase [Desulfovibrio sp.]